MLQSTNAQAAWAPPAPPSPPIWIARREVQGGPATGGSRPVVAFSSRQGPGWSRENMLASGQCVVVGGLLVEVPNYSAPLTEADLAALPWVAGWTGNARTCSRLLTEEERAAVMQSTA
jgi:hypothetical protein